MFTFYIYVNILFARAEVPRTPTLSTDKCIISDTGAYLQIQYNESVRVDKLRIYYKQTMYKGMSKKDWDVVQLVDHRRGLGSALLTGLQRGTMYQAYAVSSNDCGDSPPSNELWFRTVDVVVERKVIGR